MYQLIGTDGDYVLETADTELGALKHLDDAHLPSDIVVGAETWADVLAAAAGHDGGINDLLDEFAFAIRQAEDERPQRPGVTELGRPGDPASPLVVGVVTTRGYNREPSRAWARYTDATIQVMPSGVLRMEFRDPMDLKGKRLWADFEGDEADRLASHIQALRKDSGSPAPKDRAREAARAS